MILVVDQKYSSTSSKNDRKEALSIFKELWSSGNSPLHRMYSSWEELESNIEVKPEITATVHKQNIHQCPYCGAKQEITRPLDGIFPYMNCESCKSSFFVQSDFKVRKLSEEEQVNIPCALVEIVEDLSKKKVAVVLKLE